MKKEASLLPIVRKYFEKDVIAAVNSLESMAEEEAVMVLKALPASLSAEAFPRLQTSYAAALLKELPPSKFKDIISKLDPQHGAALFLQLPQATRETMLEQLPPKLKDEIREYLAYPEESAGRLMTTQILSFRSDLKVKEAVQKIRALAQKEFPASYAYVVDQEDKLVGVINMRDLMIANPEQTLQTIMRTEVFSVNAFMDREQIAEELGKRKYFAAPVVDYENHLLGIVKAERLIKGIQEEATEDLQKMFGAGGDERVSSTVLFSLKKRLPWLHVNLATAFLAASVVAMFESIIAKITILAVFLPVVAGQGGNAGAQSLAIVMRGIVMREIKKNQGFKIVLKEAWTGMLTGTITGVVTGLISWFWFGNPYLGVVIALAMIVNLVCAGLAGAAIPQMMKKFGLDPAQCSNIILTTVTDVVGFFAFLGFAVVFQNYLI